MGLIAELVYKSFRREKAYDDRSLYLVVEGPHSLLRAEITEVAMLDQSHIRDAARDAVWRLCEMYVDDLCKTEYWVAAGPMLRG